MHMISPLQMSCSEFAEAVFKALGKGKVHAANYYQAFYQTGLGMNAFDPKEAQAKALFHEIDARLALPVYTVKINSESLETQKIVLEFSDGLVAELVVIPMKGKLTLCISSQVGCGMGCSFCETGRMGKIRNLTTEEIVFQVYFARHILKKPIHNVVFMGMGEPFDNFEAVTKALEVLIDPLGMNMGPSHITVSTSGIVPRIYDFIPMGKRGVKLAISVNGPSDDIRQKIMPINRRYSMSVLQQALIDFTQATGKGVLAEYVLLQGINEDLESMQRLAEYLKSIPCTVNLIPYNAQSKSRFSPPSDEIIKGFQKGLMEKGFKVFVRQNKGAKIMAACGQLGQVALKKSALKNS